MTLEILSIGTAVPEHAIEQLDAAQHVVAACSETVEQDRLIKALYRRAGVRKRHSVVLDSGTNSAPATQSFDLREQMPTGPSTADRMRVYETHAGALALRAARAALSGAAVDPGEIIHLVTVSCSGFVAPGVDVALLQGLGLSPNVSRTHVGFMGCHGALNGLRVADAFANADDACVLVCAVELCSLHHQYQWDPEQIVANALFADGAAAMVGRWASAAPLLNWRLISQRSHVIPETTDLMSWRIGDHGFRMTLSPQVPRLIEQTLGPWVEALAGRLRHEPGRSRVVGDPSRRPADSRRLLDGPESAPGRTRHQPAGVGRVRQHVVADAAVHHRAADSAIGPASLRGVGLRPGHHGGSGAVGLGDCPKAVPATRGTVPLPPGARRKRRRVSRRASISHQPSVFCWAGLRATSAP